MIQNNIVKIQNKEIEDCIYVIRGLQVMVDTDVARFFQTEIKYVNRQVHRNKDRFPDDFCFQLNSQEFKSLRCQNVTFSLITKNRKYRPFVFTEHGILALAGVLNSEVAAKMSVEIVRKFVEMRKFIQSNSDLLLSLAKLQNRQIEFENLTNQKFEKIYQLIEKVDIPKEVVFFSGQVYDAYEFITRIVTKATNSIILIDPYCDAKALHYLKEKLPNTSLLIVKGQNAKLSTEDIQLFTSQYGEIELITTDLIHDRYLIIDEKDCYSLGCSLNNAGKKMFSIHQHEDKTITVKILENLNKIKRSPNL